MYASWAGHEDVPPCGVLVNLEKIQVLFDPGRVGIEKGLYVFQVDEDAAGWDVLESRKWVCSKAIGLMGVCSGHDI